MYIQIIKVTFEKLFSKWQLLSKALLIPLLLLIALEYISKNIIDPKTITIIEAFTIIATSLVISVFIAITTHRVLLLGDESIPKYGVLSFGQRELNYFFKSMALALVVLIPIFLVFLVTPYFALAGAVISIILFSRLSLVFPSIAIDENMSFKDSWELTKNYKFLTFLTLVLFPIIFAVLVGLIYGMAIEFLVKLVAPELSVLTAVLDLFITVFVIGFLSSTYMYIRTENPQFFEAEEQVIEDAREIVKSSNETITKINIDTKHNVSFESLKEELNSQYEPLGFTKIAIDKEDSWMVKNPELGTAYVHLCIKEDDFVIETYNTQEPILEIMN